MNKIIYKESDGEIIAMGSFKDVVLGEGQAVMDVDDSIPENLKHYKVDGGKISKKNKNKIDKINAEDNFDISSFLIELEGALTEERIDDLADQVRRFERYVERKQFGKMKRLGNRLVVKGKLAQAEMDGLVALFASKNINLGDY